MIDPIGRCVWSLKNDEAGKPISAIVISDAEPGDEVGRYVAVNSYDNGQPCCALPFLPHKLPPACTRSRSQRTQTCDGTRACQ